MTDLTLLKLQQVVEEIKKPKPSIRKLEKEAGLHFGTINKILNGELNLTEEKAEKLQQALKKYNL